VIGWKQKVIEAGPPKNAIPKSGRALKRKAASIQHPHVGEVKRAVNTYQEDQLPRVPLSLWGTFQRKRW
jgi:hypothetical protein